MASSSQPSSSNAATHRGSLTGGGRGSGGSGGNVGNQDEALRRMSKLVNGLYSRNDCAPFREPVDWRGLELWDYPKIIKKMMDLGTIKRKLERGQYDTASECANDIRLIWKNCIAYNADGSDFFLLAEASSKRFEDRYRKIKQEFDTGENTSSSNSTSAGDAPKGTEKGFSTNSSGGIETPSLDTKTKFSGNLFRLTGIQLGHVLQVLDLRCPKALERPTAAGWNNNHASSENSNGTNLSGGGGGGGGTHHEGDEEIEINVDAMDPQIFYELDTYVRDKIASNRRLVANNQSGGSSSNQRQYFVPSAGDQSASGGTVLSGSVSGDSFLDTASDGGKKIATTKKGKRKR